MKNKVKKYTIFVIQAFEEHNEITGSLKDICTLDVIEETADKAIARAKELIKKKHYRISSIIEKELSVTNC